MSYTASYIVNSNSAQNTTDFTFTFPYIKEEHIEVYLNYSKITQGSGSNQYQVITNVSPKLVRLNTGIASANLRVEIRRNSSLGTPLVDYADGSTLTAKDLDTSALQSLYIDQELKDNQGKTVSVDEDTGLPSLGESGTNLRLTKIGDPTAAQDAATKNYVDTKQFTSTQIQNGTLVNEDISNTAEIAVSKLADGSARQILQTDAAGTGVEWTSNVDVPGTLDVSGAVDFDSTLNVDGTASFAAINASSTITGNLTGNVTGDVSGSSGSCTGTAATATDLVAAAKVTSSEQAAHTVSDTTYFTTQASDARYFNISSGETIKDGVTFPDNDTTIATTAAINDRIIDLVDDVGGFVPIANETSFPATNPDVNNPPGAGTLVSIKEFASSHTPSSGTVTIANGAGAGNTVTITGCGSTVLAAGFGGIVETTATLHTYTFHRLSPKATEVTTVAGISANITTVGGISANVTTVANNNANVTLVAESISNVNNVGGSIANVNSVATNLNTVNDFAARYRVASTAPSTGLDAGDLYFDTSGNELKVYNGTAWQGGVTATGNLVSKAGDTITGDLIIDNGRSLKLSETDANGAHTISIKAPDSVTADTTLTLPDGAGSSGHLLSTNGSGTLNWIAPPSSTAGGGSDKVFQENDQTVTTSYTLTANKNASSVGPLTLNSGVTIEIPANATLVIL